MKTIVIWDNIDAAIKYFVLDGDYRKLDKVYIGSADNEKLWTELSEIVYYEDGNEKIEMQDHFPITEILFVEDPSHICVISCGILP